MGDLPDGAEFTLTAQPSASLKSASDALKIVLVSASKLLGIMLGAGYAVHLRVTVEAVEPSRPIPAGPGGDA